jgi:nucleotide-binding universal stress UspA family protein
MKNPMFKNIVVGVDFSDYSKIVVKQAVKLAEFYQAKLIVVHSISSMLYTNDVRMYYDIQKDIVKPMEEEVYSFYGLDKLSEKPKVYVSLSTPGALINSVAGSYKNSLILVGHRGQSKLGRFFLGSNAEYLALSAERPVWIHRGNSVGIPKKILLPSDFSPRTKTSLKIAEGFRNGSKPTLEFFHAHQGPTPVLDIKKYQKLWNAYAVSETNKRRRFQKLFPSVPFKAVDGDVAASILSESKSFDLIAMAPHNRKGLFSKLGSVTSKVVRTGETPVLVIR